MLAILALLLKILYGFNHFYIFHIQTLLRNMIYYNVHTYTRYVTYRVISYLLIIIYHS